MRQLETEKQLRERALDDVERANKEFQYQNRDLSEKAKYDEAQLRDRINELKTLKS